MKNFKSSKIFKIFDKYKFPLILIFIWLAICFANYSPNTYLTGWDNLHPEFDYSMNLKRLLTSSWAEYQGLGAPGAHSHASEIPRMFVVGVLNLFLEPNLIRYVFIFASLIIGVLGIYFVIKNGLLRRKDKGLREFAAFSTALFYMLNVGTVQHFQAPFEMFNVQYALLPWLVLIAIKFLETKKYKYLLYFGIITFFSAPMAYAVMLWIAYFGGLTIFLTINFILQRKKELFLPSIFLIAVTLLVNLFWLVPNLYFVFNHSDYVPTAKTNLIFSEEAFLTNQKYGNIVDIFLNKGFLFDWQIRNTNYTFEPIMGDWDKHIDNPLVLVIALLCFALIVVGILYAIYRRQKYYIPLIGVLLFTVVIIMGTNPPFGGLWEVLVSKISVLQEAIRFPFTKFSILFIFTQACFLAAGTYVVAKLLHSRIKFQFAKLLALIVVLLVAFIYAWPTFQGNFINKSLRINIPSDYFQTFDYFKDQDQGTRIANFPVNSLFGWFYTDWGYQGSGFLWYGIEQPILDRDFDRWYTTLEDYYDNVSSAIYTNNAEALRDVLKKYAIDWILIDEHVTSSSEDNNYSLNPDLATSEMAYKETKALLEQIPEVHKAETFGKIHIYKIEGLNNDSSYIDVLSNNENGNPIEQKSIFLEDNFGRKTKESFFEKLNKEYVNYYNNVYTLDSQQGYIEIPQIYEKETSIPANVSSRLVNDKVSIRLTYQIPTVYINNKSIFNSTKVRTIEFPLKSDAFNYYLSLDNQIVSLNDLSPAWKNFGYINIPLDKDLIFNLYNVDEGENITSRLDLEEAEINNCTAQDISRSSSVSYDNDVLTFRSTGENICIDFKINTLNSINNLYQLSMDYKSNQGVIGDSCIKIDGACVNTKEYRSDYLPTFWYPFNTYAENANSNSVGVSLVFNNGLPENTASISYRNIKLLRYQLESTQTISMNEVKNDLNIEETKIAVTPQDNKLAVKFSIPLNQIYKLDYTKLQQIISLASKDCKPYIDVIKLNRSLNYDNKEINFESIDGFNCENINLYNISLKNGFLIDFEGSNTSGPGLVLNVSDFYYKKVYYTNRLSEEAIYSEFVTIPKLIDSPANGLNIFINNQSVGNEETVNSIKSISVSPIIYSWLSSLKFNSNEYYSSDKSLESVNKFSTTTYSAEVNPAPFNRILKFNQSYEANWLAYDSRGNILERLGNLNTDTEKAEWNNYWILPAGVEGIYIEYRTQTYQYFAYLVVGIVFLILIVASVWQSEKSSKTGKRISKIYNKFMKKRDLFLERNLEPKLDKYKKFNKKDLQ